MSRGTCASKFHQVRITFWPWPKKAAVTPSLFCVQDMVRVMNWLVTSRVSPMQVDNGHEQNDASLPFADNDEVPDPPVLDASLPLAMRPIIDDDLPKYKPFSLGPMKVKCPHCHAFHFDCDKSTNSTRQNPIFGSCYMNGKVVLLFLQKIWHIFSVDSIGTLMTFLRMPTLSIVPLPLHQWV
jgi:hypothetical protein